MIVFQLFSNGSPGSTANFLKKSPILVGIPLSYSIADGLALGFITYPIINSERPSPRDWLVDRFARSDPCRISYSCGARWGNTFFAFTQTVVQRRFKTFQYVLHP